MTVRVSDEQLAALAARHEELGGDGPLVRCLRELQEAREREDEIATEVRGQAADDALACVEMRQEVLGTDDPLAVLADIVLRVRALGGGSQIREALEFAEETAPASGLWPDALSALDRLVAEREGALEQCRVAAGREAALREAAALVVLLDERERAGDETLSGHEWGEAMAKLAAACSVHALAAVPAADPPQDKAVT